MIQLQAELHCIHIGNLLDPTCSLHATDCRVHDMYIVGNLLVPTCRTLLDTVGSNR